LTDLPAPFPEASKTERVLQLAVTRRGFDFIEQNVTTLITQFLPNGLTFDVPPQTGGDTEICYTGGVCTINGNIRSVKLDLVPAQVVRATLRLDLTSNKIPVRYRVPVIGRISCDLEARINNKEIRTDLTFGIDPRNKGLRIDISDPVFSVSGSDFRLSGGLQCTLADVLKGFFTSLIEREIKKALNDILKEITCMKCKTDADCPAQLGAVCRDDICTEGGRCLPIQMGVEGRMETGALLGSFGNASAKPIDIALQIGGSTDVQTTGLRIGSLGGSLTEPHPCVEPKNLPALAAPPLVTFPATAPDSANSPYMIGAGVSQVLMDRLMRDFYHSGALCLRLDSSISDQVGTFFRAQGLGGAISPSLLQLVGKENPPLYIVMRPSEIPDISIGKGDFITNPQGQKQLNEPLLEVAIRKLDLDFYLFLYDRWVRLLTYRTDIVLPLGLEPRPNNMLGLILGDLGKAFQNPTVLNSYLIKEKPEDVATGFSSLLQALLPVLVGQIGQTEFAIPEVEGFALKVNAITGMLPRADRPNRFQFLSLFADLALAPPAMPQMPALPALISARHLRTEIPESVRASLQQIQQVEHFPAVWLEIDGATEGWEYAARIGNGLWHPFTASSRLRLESPIFLRQGDHVISLRARRAEQPQGAEVAVGSVIVRMDYTPPALQATIQEQGIQIAVNDNLAPYEAISLSYRAKGQEKWLPAERFLPAAHLPTQALLSLRATDPSGNTTQIDGIAWQGAQKHLQPMEMTRLPRQGMPSPFLEGGKDALRPTQPPAMGCQAAPLAPFWPPLLGIFLLVFLRPRRPRL
jgi:hypothetical protein